MTARTPMVWTGGLFATGGLLLVVLRLIGAHRGIPYLGGSGTGLYFGAAVGILIVGFGLVLSAPQARRRRGRVQLDERPVQEDVTLRPSHRDGIPTTSGFQSAQAPPAAPDPKPNAGPAAAQATATTVLAGPDHNPERSAAKAAWGRPRDAPEPPMRPGRSHPNAAHADAGQRSPGRAPRPLDADEAHARQAARRGELIHRLEELEQKANQAKVRFGLGKVSAAGYRQYLAEVDRERMMIESELMETEE